MKKCPFCAEEIQDEAIVCKHCGRDLKAGVTQVQLVAPKKKTSVAAWGCLTILVLLALVWLVGSLTGPNSREPTGSTPAELRLPARGDPPSDLIARFGAPDMDDSTERDVPRPPMVTRFLTWKKANVRAAYIADAQMGEPPPYKGWRLIGFTDAESVAAITSAEAVRRLTTAR